MKLEIEKMEDTKIDDAKLGKNVNLYFIIFILKI